MGRMGRMTLMMLGGQGFKVHIQNLDLNPKTNLETMKGIKET
jgi:hypothetical protein